MSAQLDNLGLETLLYQRSYRLVDFLEVRHGGWLLLMAHAEERCAVYVAEFAQQPIYFDNLIYALEQARAAGHCLRYLVSPAGLAQGAERLAAAYRLALLG